MIPKSCRLFGRDYASETTDMAHMGEWTPKVKVEQRWASLTHGKAAKRPFWRGAWRHPPARREGQDRQGAEDRLDSMAPTPAQRSLCRGGEAARTSLARRLQARRDRRQVPSPQARYERGRSRSSARRLE